MAYNVKPTSLFKREFKRLSKRYRSLQNDVKRLIDELEENPLLGADLGNGVHKVRLAITSKGKGKSHGARVITYTEAIICADEEGVVTLLTIYDKSDRDTISSMEIATLLASLGDPNE